MKRMALIGVCVAAAALGLAGCDWDTGSDADHWNSDYNWVNFSGTYRSAAGGLLVTDYTTTPSTPGSTNTLQSSGEAQRRKRPSQAQRAADGEHLPRGEVVDEEPRHAFEEPAHRVPSAARG